MSSSDRLRQATALRLGGRLAEAEVIYNDIVATEPDNVEALNLKGVACCQRGAFEEGIFYLRKALEIRPDYTHALFNHAQALQYLQKDNEALEGYGKVLSLDPSYIQAHFNSGIIYNSYGRYHEALTQFDSVISRNAGFADALFYKALIKLRRGEFEEGWRLYEWRLSRTDREPDRQYTQPPWDGLQPLKGKTILLHTEQGFGDAIQFYRYVPMVEALGASVVLEVHNALVPLLSVSMSVVERGKPLPPHDFQFPLMSLPCAFNTGFATIPAAIPYLKADKDKCDQWAQVLGAKKRRRVGLVWAGSSAHRNDHNRSLVTEYLAELLKADCDFVALQKEIRVEDKLYLHAHGVMLFPERLQDFSDTAALIEQMDLVISVDTAVAHLAGALGKAVWVMLPFVADFRWLEGRSDSPWYPTAKLFRQPSLGDWHSVVRSVARELMQ